MPEQSTPNVIELRMQVQSLNLRNLNVVSYIMREILLEEVY